MFNCIGLRWIIVGFLILTKLLAYTFFLEDISLSLIFVLQKHPNFQPFLPGKFQSSLGDLLVCALREYLEDFGRIQMYALLLLLLLLLLVLLIFIIIIIYNSTLCLTKQKEKRKKIALPRKRK